MLKALVKTRIQMLFATMFSRASKRKRGAGGKALFAILFIYVAACFFGMFFALFTSLCEPFYEARLGWLYFSLCGIMAFALCFIGSVFTAQQQLFGAKDNEMLLAMPIPPYAILASRMISLLALNYLFAVFVMLPAGVVWCLHAPATVMGIVAFVLSFLFLPLLSLALSSLFGWALAWIESKLRRKNIISVVFSLAFLAAYFYFYSKVQTYLNLLVANGAAIGDAIRKAVPPAYHMGVAVAEGNAVSLLLFILFCAVPMAIVLLLLTRNFVRIATTSRGTARVKYKGESLRARGVKSALFRKELGHFLGSPSYLINAGLGALFMVVVAVLLAVKSDGLSQILAVLEHSGISTASAACAVYCLCGSMVFVTAPSVSLEAKTFWISRTMPVSSGDVLLAKANAHIVFCLPFIVVSAVITIAFIGATALEAALLFVLPFILTCFIAYFGLVMNLCFPKLDWTNEIYVIKQSASSMFSMFGSMAIILIPAAVYALLLRELLPIDLYLLICAVVFALAALLLRRWLVTAGARRFEEI